MAAVRIKNWSVVTVLLVAASWTGVDAQPQVEDDRLTIELFADREQLGTPIGMAVDRDDRVYVVESHTHKRPDGYEGPEQDRIRVLSDEDGDGRADKGWTFCEGFHLASDVAIGPKGWVYVASRYEIERFRDTDGDGRADESRQVARLDTDGSDPHDGLHGLSFDDAGRLHFGLGENAGKPYELIGSDGRRLTGGGEGGSVYRCEPDGSEIERLAIGFWNPTSSAVDVFDRWLITDNDPDSSPPCRLIHIVSGGHYGFAYRYGRSGLHPLQAWDGELPGMLPMAHGTAEAPTDMIVYESDGLPDEYRGRLLVVSWADHRIEQFTLKPRGAGLAAERSVLVRGGMNFRPVGIDTSPDGTLYVSDWIRGQYSIHGEGRIWRIRSKEPPSLDRPDAAREALHAVDRTTRRRAARHLAKSTDGQEYLRQAIEQSSDDRVRAMSLITLANSEDAEMDFARAAESLERPALRAMAVSFAIERGTDPARFLDGDAPPPVKAAVLRRLRLPENREPLMGALTDPDPFLRTAAIDAMRHTPEALLKLDVASLNEAGQRLGVLLALQRSGHPEAADRLGPFLDDPDHQVRFAAVKWVADDRLERYENALKAVWNADDLDLRLFHATLAAIDHLEGRSPSSRPATQRLAALAFDKDQRARVRRLALRLIEPDAEAVTVDRLRPLLDDPHPALRMEAVRTLQHHPSQERFAHLARIAADASRPAAERAEAVVGLAGRPDNHLELLLGLARGDEPTLQREALRALVGLELKASQTRDLRQIGSEQPALQEAIQRVLQGAPGPRPSPHDLDAWTELASGEGDVAAGRRVFFHPKVGTCSTCHRMNGRGTRVGPDLSRIGRDPATTNRQLLRSILQPAAEIAPEYVPWEITLVDDQKRVGLSLRKGGNREAYRAADGSVFSLPKGRIRSHRELEHSLMPPGLAAILTRTELRDLLTFLQQPTEAQEALTTRVEARE